MTAYTHAASMRICRACMLANMYKQNVAYVF